MTGLCGLGLAIRYQSDAGSVENDTTCIICTDGNPDCVSNQRTCWLMNQQKLQQPTAVTPSATAISSSCTNPLQDIWLMGNGMRYGCMRLRWDKNDSFGELTGITNAINATANNHTNETLYADIILGADCLFFKEFHIDLLYTIYRLLGNAYIYIYM